METPGPETDLCPCPTRSWGSAEQRHQLSRNRHTSPGCPVAAATAGEGHMSDTRATQLTGGQGSGGASPGQRMTSVMGKGPARPRGIPGRLAMGRPPRQPISGGQNGSKDLPPTLSEGPWHVFSGVPTPHYAKLAVPITGAGDRGTSQSRTLPRRRGQAGAPPSAAGEPRRRLGRAKGGPAGACPRRRSLAAVLARAVQECVQGGPEVLAYLLLRRECGRQAAGAAQVQGAPAPGPGARGLSESRGF